MAVPTSRTKIKADRSINEKVCTGCGLCAYVCKDFSIEIVDGKPSKSDNPLFGCIACGHCMAICPSGAIEVTGRTLSADDLFELPDKKDATTYEQLFILLTSRRSIREFKDIPVEKEMIINILNAARTAPMGLPPSDVNVLIFNTREKGNNFARQFCSYLEGIKWFFSDWFLFLMRPFWGKANDELFRDFIKPLVYAYTENMRQGVNIVTYDAPLTMYFYGTPYSDPADPVIAATYAMIAAETLGLGSCMLGGIHPMIQSGKKANKFRKGHGIKHKSREGLFVIFGYPDVKYKKGVNRTFAAIDYA